MSLICSKSLNNISFLKHFTPHLHSPDERHVVDDWLEDDPEETPEREVHDLGLDLAHAELDVAVGGEDEVHVHDDLVATHVLVVHLDARDPTD